MAAGIADDLVDLLADEACQGAANADRSGSCRSPLFRALGRCLDQRDEGILHRRIGGSRRVAALRLELVGRAERDLPAAIDQRDAVAIFRLVHEMRGDEHGHALLDQPVDVRPEFAPRDRIDAARSARRGTAPAARACTAQASARRCLKPAAGRRRRCRACASSSKMLDHRVDALAPARAAADHRRRRRSRDSGRR